MFDSDMFLSCRAGFVASNASISVLKTLIIRYKKIITCVEVVMSIYPIADNGQPVMDIWINK